MDPNIAEQFRPGRDPETYTTQAQRIKNWRAMMPDSDISAMGLKLLYSYISTGCFIQSHISQVVEDEATKKKAAKEAALAAAAVAMFGSADMNLWTTAQLATFEQQSAAMQAESNVVAGVGAQFAGMTPEQMAAELERQERQVEEDMATLEALGM